MTISELDEQIDRTAIIPLSTIPAQRFQCVLNGQNCIITIKKRGLHCYFSLTANGNVVTQNTICLCGNNLVPYKNQNFDGSIFFIDTSGHYSTPNYNDFNTRYKLVYLPFRVDEVDTSVED